MLPGKRKKYKYMYPVSRSKTTPDFEWIKLPGRISFFNNCVLTHILTFSTGMFNSPTPRDFKFEVIEVSFSGDQYITSVDLHTRSLTE